MESFFSRYRNETVLMAILFVQVIALATQVRVPNAGREGSSAQTGSTRLIRVWAVGMVSPFQRLYVHSGLGFRNLWHNYVDLRGIRKENARIQQELEQMRLEQVRSREDVEQGRRLQALLGFKEQFIGRTLAAQVVGSSGTELSRVIYIDRGTHDGVEAGMAVITPDGIVGKISRADRNTSQVLLITDPSSGAGVIMERLRLNGVLKGSTSGYAEVQNIMADEEIKPGDRIVTTGGDHVFPKGLPVGSVVSVSPDRDRDPFLAVKVKPSVNLAHLEEVLVVTELKETNPEAQQSSTAPVRAADMLAERLPTYKKKAEQDKIKADKAARKPDASGEGPSQLPSDSVQNPSSAASASTGVATTPAKIKPANPGATPNQSPSQKPNQNPAAKKPAQGLPGTTPSTPQKLAQPPSQSNAKPVATKPNNAPKEPPR